MHVANVAMHIIHVGSESYDAFMILWEEWVWSGAKDLGFLGALVVQVVNVLCHEERVNLALSRRLDAVLL